MATHRSRTWIFASIIIIAVVLVIIFAPRQKIQTTETVSTTTPPTLEQKMVLTSKTIKDENSTAGYAINATYPQVTGLAHSDAELKINSTISDHINGVIADFKNSLDNGGTVPTADQSTLDITYVLEPNTTIPNLMSIRLVESFFDSGAAHPGQTIETLNYNTSTGAEVTLDDIFSSPDYVQRLSTYTNSELKKKLGNDPSLSSQIDSGTTPAKENFSTFVFTDTGINIIFQEYQVASYAAGVQEVLVPYSAIKDILNQNGPLAFLFK